MTTPFDYTEYCCSQDLGFVADAVVVEPDAVVVVVVVNGADAVDTGSGFFRHQRQCSDYYDTQHSDYCYCAAVVVDIEYSVRSVEHNCHTDRSIWVDGSDVVQLPGRYLKDCEHFAKRYYECYFVAHNFVTDSLGLGYYDDCYVLGMVVVVAVVVVVVDVGISVVDSLVVYADDYYFVMRTIVNYLVRAPGLIVVDGVMEVVNDCVVKVVVVAELVTASMVVDIVTMIRPLTFRRSTQIHCLLDVRQPSKRENKTMANI